MKRIGWLAALVIAGCGAGPQSSATASPASVQVEGAATCPADQVQDLTLTGALTGHVGCSTAPPQCHRIHGPHSPGMKFAIWATSAARSVIIQIEFGNDHLGTFPATEIGDAPGLDQQGVVVSGVGDWSTAEGAGTLTVVLEQSPTLDSEGRVSGSLDVRLTSGSSTAGLKGAWTCFKTLAGGDGWSSA